MSLEGPTRCTLPLSLPLNVLPAIEVVDLPEPSPDEVVVEVLAAGLHPRVRSGAAGTHYANSGALPFVPGIDGVGQLPDGQRVYFLAIDSPHGSMAERTVIDRRRCISLPDSVDDLTVAAAMNPAMSSWLALQARAQFTPGQRVLVLGATGNAGQMAVQLAKHLGAGWVVGAGRDEERLAALKECGADAVVSLAGDPVARVAALKDTARDMDVVLDYLWGPAAEDALPGVLTARSQANQPLTWIEVGSITGPTLTLPSAALRGHNLRIIGSGQGSLSAREILATLPGLIDVLAAGALRVNTRAVPLSEVEAIWNAPTVPGQRIVLVP